MKKLSLFGLALFFVVAVLVSTGKITAFDLAIMKFAYATRTPGLTRFMSNIGLFGEQFLPYITVLIALALMIKKYYREAVAFLLITVGGELVNVALKHIFQRPRPVLAPLFLDPTFSFPSGHSMNSFIMYMVLSFGVYYFTKDRRWTWLSVVLAGSLVVLIGWSRIYLGVHYPSDVLAGFAAGLCWLAGILTKIPGGGPGKASLSSR